MSVIVIRLHPEKPVSGDDFKKYLEGLVITAKERSFANPKGTEPAATVLGTASYIAEGDPNATIIQHWSGPPILTRQPVATAAIHIADPFPFVEYRLPDLTLTITRTVAPSPARTIVNHDINFNVELAPGALPPPVPPAYAALAPVSLYLALPKPLIGLGPGVAFVDVPTDGTPPAFQAVLDAMKTVLMKDPGALPDLTKLTPEQCRHIAYEIVSNRTLDPLPTPGASLESMYTPGGSDTQRQQFEADLVTWYTVHNTRADVLAKFIYSVSAALACNQNTKNATKVGFTFPILPGIGKSGEKIAEATVVVSQ